MTAVLIRHGATQGNLEGRYIGCRTDEPLCPQGIAALAGRSYPPVTRVFVSPMLRCAQTAAILYPGLSVTVVHGLRECDFGEFENRNYAELNGHPAYQRFIDSGGEAAFPGGECRAEFAARCVRAYKEASLSVGPEETAAFIVHGGTIMAIMERYARPAGRYFDFQVRAGEGFVLEDGGGYRRLDRMV